MPTQPCHPRVGGAFAESSHLAHPQDEGGTGSETSVAREQMVQAPSSEPCYVLPLVGTVLICEWRRRWGATRAGLLPPERNPDGDVPAAIVLQGMAGKPEVASLDLTWVLAVRLGNPYDCGQRA